MTMQSELSAKFANMSFISACFVVCIHSGGFLGPIVNSAVPFFFLCSGYMMARHTTEKGWYGAALKKRLLSIGIPYFAWILIQALVSFPFSAYADYVAGRPFGYSMQLLQDPLSGFGFTLAQPYVGPLWFLRNLMLLVVLSPVLQFFIERFSWSWLAFCFFADILIGLWFPSFGRFDYLFRVSGLFYFSAGWLFRLRRTSCGARISFFAAFAIGVAVAFWDGDLWAEKASVPFLMYALWGCVPACRFPDWMLSSTFLIFVAHILVRSLFGIISRRMAIPEHGWQVANWFVSIVVLIGVNYWMRRFFPRIMRFVLGGR